MTAETKQLLQAIIDECRKTYTGETFVMQVAEKCYEAGLAASSPQTQMVGKGDVVWVRGIFDGPSIYDDEVRILLHKRDDKDPTKPNHLYFVRRDTIAGRSKS